MTAGLRTRSPVPQIEIGAFSAELLSLPSPLFDSLLSEGRMWWWVGFNVLLKDSLHFTAQRRPNLLLLQCRNWNWALFNSRVNCPAPNSKPTMCNIQSWKESVWSESLHQAQHFFQCLQLSNDITLIFLNQYNSVSEKLTSGVFPDKRFNQYAGGGEDNLDNLDNSPNVVLWIPLD